LTIGHVSLSSLGRRPTLVGLLRALVKVLPFAIGFVVIWVQLEASRGVILAPPYAGWDGSQTWFQAERIRAGEPLYQPLPGYGPHVMADQMDGWEPYPIASGATPHLPLAAAVVALTPLESLEEFKAAWIVTLLLATWGFVSILVILAHGQWTFVRFLWWNSVTFLTPAFLAFRLGNPDPILWLLFAGAVAVPARFGAAGLVLAAAIKPFAVWPLGFSLVRGPETWKAAVASAAVVVALCLAALGPADLVRSARDWFAYVPGVMGQGTFNQYNVSLSFGVLRSAYAFGLWDYRPGPIMEAWPRIWLAFAQVTAPLLAGVLTYSWDRRLHLSAVMLAALLFSPLCWNYYLTLALVPLALWIRRRGDHT
jgi:hypothetical protein